MANSTPIYRELRRQRRRARLSQQTIAGVLNVSLASISNFETRGAALPHELTPDDYEAALQALIVKAS